ncbi:MAG: type II toxin-antitoxin system ParD family antitoxin [Pseudomonadota bacterium]
MGTVRKTTTLSAAEYNWIKGKVAAGRYLSFNDCIHDLIRREREHCEDVEAIRAALIEGDANEQPWPFEAEAGQHRLHSTHN